jgi:hypothetical protein
VHRRPRGGRRFSTRRAPAGPSCWSLDRGANPGASVRVGTPAHGAPGRRPPRQRTGRPDAAFHPTRHTRSRRAPRGGWVLPLRPAGRAHRPGRGGDVRAHAPQCAAELRRVGLHRPRVGRVDGALVERRSDAWVVAANSLYASGGNRFEAGAFVLDVPTSAVSSGRKCGPTVLVANRGGGESRRAGRDLLQLAEAMRGTSTSGTDGPGNGGERVVIPLP